MRRTGVIGNILPLTVFVFLSLTMLVPPAWSQASEDQQGQAAIVGRISDIEGGQLLRYVPADHNWVVTVKDAPFGLNDALYAGDDTKAEFLMPNNTRIRVSGDTQLQLIALQPDYTQADVASGTARFYNRSDNGVIKVTTPYGYVVSPGGTGFDVYVGDNSAEVISVQGTVNFIHDPDQEKFEVIAGSSSIVADKNAVTTGPGRIDVAWADWNTSRDNLWAQRVEVKGASTQYLPENLRDQAYDLDQNGRWERVYYEGEYRNFWRPNDVGPDWAPYTVGRWTDYYGDNCWIPDEPFGYVTMHYGNWLWADNGWFWAPPVPAVGIGLGFGWFPGRVGWLYSGLNVGWFPLAPFEPYYARHWWGGRTVVVNNFNTVNVNINNYRFANRAVVVRQNDLYRVNNYRTARQNISGQQIARNFRAAPALNNQIVRGYSQNRDRFAFTNARPAFTPRQAAVNRITQNERTARQAARFSPAAVQRSLTSARPGRVSQGMAIAPPRIGNRPINPGAVRAAEVPASPQNQNRQRIAGPPPIQPGRTGNTGIPAVRAPGSPQGGRQVARPNVPPPPPPEQRRAVGPGSSSQGRTAVGPPQRSSGPQAGIAGQRPGAAPGRQFGQGAPVQQRTVRPPQTGPQGQRSFAQRQGAPQTSNLGPPRSQMSQPQRFNAPPRSAQRPQMVPQQGNFGVPRAPAPRMQAPRPQMSAPRQAPALRPQMSAPRAAPASRPQMSAPRPQAAAPQRGGPPHGGVRMGRPG